MSADIRATTIFTTLAALAATAVMLVPGVAIAWRLARRQFPGKSLVETAVSLPLVMPPVATGLILLWLFGRRGPLGALLARAGIEIVFTPAAVVMAMAVMGLPLLVRTARAGFEQVTRRYEQIYVTHLPEEALSVADWAVLIDNGRVVTSGPPSDVMPSMNR